MNVGRMRRKERTYVVRAKMMEEDAIAVYQKQKDKVVASGEEVMA